MYFDVFLRAIFCGRGRHAVVVYLCVAKQEDDWLVLDAGFEHHLLEVIVPVRQTVVLGQLDLKQVVLGTEYTPYDHRITRHSAYQPINQSINQLINLSIDPHNSDGL